jgi:hypothetical protein
MGVLFVVHSIVMCCICVSVWRKGERSIRRACQGQHNTRCSVKQGDHHGKWE